LIFQEARNFLEDGARIEENHYSDLEYIPIEIVFHFGMHYRTKGIASLHSFAYRYGLAARTSGASLLHDRLYASSTGSA